VQRKLFRCVKSFLKTHEKWTQSCKTLELLTAGTEVGSWPGVQAQGRAACMQTNTAVTMAGWPPCWYQSSSTTSPGLPASVFEAYNTPQSHCGFPQIKPMTDNKHFHKHQISYRQHPLPSASTSSPLSASLPRSSASCIRLTRVQSEWVSRFLMTNQLN